jgi:hypothetical protein
VWAIYRAWGCVHERLGSGKNHAYQLYILRAYSYIVANNPTFNQCSSFIIFLVCKAKSAFDPLHQDKVEGGLSSATNNSRRMQTNPAKVSMFEKNCPDLFSQPTQWRVETRDTIRGRERESHSPGRDDGLLPCLAFPSVDLTPKN